MRDKAYFLTVSRFLGLILLLAPSPACSTLVVFVPTKMGLVIAAESRATVPGSIYCDGKSKIIISPHSRLAVAAITGNQSWFNFPGVPRDKVCEWMTQNTPIFDLAPIVEGFLDEHAKSVTRSDLEDLRDRCVRAHQEFFSRNLEVATLTTPGELSQILIGTFDRKTLVSSVWSFKIVVDNSFPRNPMGGEITLATWSPTSKGDAYVTGETEYFNQYVKFGLGSQIHCKPTVFATDALYGRRIATGLVRAASRTAEKIPPPHGIGGPIDVTFVNGRSPVAVTRVTNTLADEFSAP